MRYTPVALALSLVVAVSSSVLHSSPTPALDPRAAALVAQGREEMAAGRHDAAIDAFEAALTLEPGSAEVLVNLATATRRTGLQGRAIHYYRQALEIEPRNVSAIAGEGVALAEKGATEKANRNLARLKSLCGGCAESQQLATAIARGPTPKMVSAASVKPKPLVSGN
ncbi:tetratricopeptide repeat protein [Novosphingobium sp. M1R2S20]|uniref:Tetratricopeptide repeat protein n=1 Tax=Novosphingobium rhizovicinum TaxID=3228928 RepID=A0ABV3R6E1_9SPHN